jgi:translation initiation factor eIF-2B subunit epsilon
MLDYTVEFLAQNSVKEVFVFCVWHAEILQEYIKNKKWPSSITVTCLSSSACLSAGDALREIDSMGVIRSDPFILISGDVVSNMNLKAAIDFHRERKRVDNNAIMTVALKRVQNGAGIRPVMDDLVVAMDRSTQQLLLFENDLSKKGVSIPLELMAEHPGLALRSDLLDCQVDVCSPELLLQFSDNFDYQVRALVGFLTCRRCSICFD